MDSSPRCSLVKSSLQAPTLRKSKLSDKVISLELEGLNLWVLTRTKRLFVLSNANKLAVLRVHLVSYFGFGYSFT